MSVWRRLRHHKVAQWTLAYAASAYTFLHAVEMVSGALGWPHFVVRIVTLVLLLGVPVVVTLAWFHGFRARQRVSGPELAILTGLFALAGVALWLLGKPDQGDVAGPAAAPGSAAEGFGATSPAMAPERSIAVLPFENRSTLREDAIFVDGIHDDILTQLSKASALVVVSRTSVERFRNSTLPARAIAGQLGVRSILEGGVQRAGDRVRINVQLIDADTDTHVWAETYDRALTAANVFAIQSDVANAIVRALKATLTAREQVAISTVPTQSLPAWEAFQLGRQRMARRTSDSLAEAGQLFQRAIEMDPAFALAYVGLADTLYLTTYYAGAPVVPTLARADEAIEKAVRLNPHLAEAWTSMAGFALAREQFDRAEYLFQRALELNTNYATAHQWYSEMLRYHGRFDEAMRHAEIAVALDPLSPITNVSMADLLEIRGNFDAAKKRYGRVVEIDPTIPGPYYRIGMIEAYAFNRFANGVVFVEKAVELDPGSPDFAIALAKLYLDLGDDSTSDAWLARAMEIAGGDSAAHDDASKLAAVGGDAGMSLEEARKALAGDPREQTSLLMLRNADLAAGDVQAALLRYETAYPELFADELPPIAFDNAAAVGGLVLVLQQAGDFVRASTMLDGLEEFIQTIPRMGHYGSQILDVELYALRGKKREALAALRAAEKAGWRAWWQYCRDIEPNLASIRADPEFKAIFADIEHDMARQRAQLAARPKDTPLDFASLQ